MVTWSNTILSNNVFNVCIRCIWFNATYIMPNIILPHCNLTVPLVQHCIISNTLLYGVSYLKAALLVRMNLSPT